MAATEAAYSSRGGMSNPKSRRRDDIEIGAGPGSSLPPSIQYQEDGYSRAWYGPEFVEQRWKNMPPAAKNAYAERLRRNEVMGAQIDLSALAAANVEGRPSGPSTMFTPQKVKSVRIVKAALPDMNSPSAVAVTETAWQPNSSSADRLPNSGAPDPRSSALAFITMFGKAPETARSDPYLATSREYHDFPEWFKTTPPQYTTKILMNLSVSYASWHMSDFAPYKALTSESFGVIKWEFNPALANRTAFEAPVHILAHQQETSKESAIRWGIGIHMELGFWNTDLGRFIYAKQLEQLANTVYLTMVVNAEYALYHADSTADTLQDYLRMPLDDRAFRLRLIEEDLEFDAGHKPGGLNLLASRARKIFQKRNLPTEGMRMVLPESAWDAYVAAYPENSSVNVAAIYKTRPIQTAKHEERNAAQVGLTHGAFVYCDPMEPKMYGNRTSDSKFESSSIMYERFFDDSGLFRPTSYQKLFQHGCFYDYSAMHAAGRSQPARNGGGSKGLPDGFPRDWDSGKDGYPATGEVGFQILCTPWLSGYSEDSDPGPLFRDAIMKSLPDADAKDKASEAGRFPTAAELYKRYLKDPSIMPKLVSIINDRINGVPKRLTGFASAKEFLDLNLVTSKFFDLCFSADIPVLLPIFDFAAHQSRQSQTVSFYIPGAANTYIGFPMAMFGRDPIIATASLSLWWYSRCVALKEHIINFHAASICGYDAGNDETFWDYGDEVLYQSMKEQSKDASRQDSVMDRFASRFAVICLPGSEGPMQGRVDLSGKFNQYYTSGGPKSAAKEALHYNTARIYAAHWGWEPCVREQWLTNSFLSQGSPISNTICFLAPCIVPGLPGSVQGTYIEGTSLMRHLDFPGANAVRSGLPQPLLTGKEFFDRMARIGRIALPWSQM